MGDGSDNLLESIFGVGNTRPLSVVEIPFRDQILFGIRTLTAHSTAAWKIIGEQQALSELLERLSRTNQLRTPDDAQSRDNLFAMEPEIDDPLRTLAGSGSGIEPKSRVFHYGQQTLFHRASWASKKVENLNKKRFSFEELHSSGIPSEPSPLYNCHKALGASFTHFAGYEMPLSYTSNILEHQHVRKHAGLFDLSHKVLLDFRGHGAERFLDLVLTEHISQLDTGESCRACILSPEGMIISDCILYRLASDHFIMELEPFTAQMAESWLRAVAAREVIIDLARPGIEVDRICSITNLKTCSDPLIILALQGPKSTIIMQSFLNDNKSHSILSNLRKGHIRELSFAGFDGWIARRGYTGEPVGYEIILPQAQVESFWNALMKVGLAHSLGVIGLSAADSLRIEAGLPLYGKELAGPYHGSPVEVGFGSCIKLQKPFFIGRQYMLYPSLSRKFVRLHAEIDATHMTKLEPTMQNDSGKIIGRITSSAYISGQFYGLGLLDEKAFDKEKIYLSYSGSPVLLTEVVPVPYSAVIEA